MVEEKRKLICVLCGQEWGVKCEFTNRCENPNCDGFCTWGYELNKPLSWNIDNEGKWRPNPAPKDSKMND